MKDTVRREVECQNFLPGVNYLLTPPFAKVVQVVREQVAMAGRSDYFLLCEVREVEIRRRLILWEVKAPQLSAFETSSCRNRLIPSKSLIEAENQLLYYFDEYRSNGQFLDRYNLRHPDDVKLGGIIIGRDDNWVALTKGNTETKETIQQMASSAVRIRDEHFYRGRIRLMSWDRVLELMEAQELTSSIPPAQIGQASV